jgi:hypothetical protein
MEVIRRLNSVTSQMGTLDGPLHSHTEIGAGRGIGEDGLPPLMAVNVIRAHREELVQASSGTVDKLVIDIVGTLFDQILSDNRLAPPLAHQIARLQLPVLRVALADVSFFSSRKHPVRRFVNRLASLGSGFEGLTEGSGALFLTRVKQIVHEIVEGEFDRPETYSAKLDELERFISEDASAALEGAGATVSLLESKETELRIQQRYMQQLQTALAEVDVPEYLREFMAQIWSQAIVVANRRHGDNDEVTLTMRKVGRDLLLSTLPKGAPAQRQRFLAQLPALMRDLKTGLKLIGLPEAAQKDFLGQLMTSHAAALKGAALSELDYNLLAKQLDTVFSAPLPTGESRASRLDAGAGNADVQPIENRFSEEEASQIGLLSEASVDWSGAVDIDLSEPEAAAGHPPQFSESAANDDVPDLAPEEVDSAHIELEGGVDIQLDLSSPDPSEASSGLGLLENLQIGFAYRMLLKDTWQKVRLNYISPGRTFFVFTHGKGQQHTVSLTARMLERMCETQRLRALESSYLMERATARARKQLAAIKRSAEKTA